MKRISLYAVLIAVAVVNSVFTACGDDDEKVGKYDLTLNFALSSELSDANITKGQVIIAKGTVADTIEVKDLTKPITVNKVQGSYTVTFNGKIADEAQAYVTGTAQAELYSNISLKVSLEKARKSSLVFKTIYSTGGAKFYVRDSYLEIVNNSDEVQYLDGLMLAAPLANFSAQSPWQTT